MATSYMERSALRPIIKAVGSVCETSAFPVGVSVAPDCDRPYYVVTSVSSPRYDGPFLHAPEADSMDRIQVASVSDTADQADWLRDKVRELLTIAALDQAFVDASVSRRTLRVILDIPRGVQRDDRGLPAPIFTSIDQYMIETTPL